MIVFILYGNVLFLWIEACHTIMTTCDGFRVKQRNFVFLLFFQSTDVSTGVRKAKSRHDMDTAGLREEIISLCIFTELRLIDTAFLRLLKLKMTTAFDHMVRFS